MERLKLQRHKRTQNRARCFEASEVTQKRAHQVLSVQANTKWGKLSFCCTKNTKRSKVSCSCTCKHRAECAKLNLYMQTRRNGARLGVATQINSNQSAQRCSITNKHKTELAKLYLYRQTQQRARWAEAVQENTKFSTPSLCCTCKHKQNVLSCSVMNKRKTKCSKL